MILASHEMSEIVNAPNVMVNTALEVTYVTNLPTNIGILYQVNEPRSNVQLIPYSPVLLEPAFLPRTIIPVEEHSTIPLNEENIPMFIEEDRSMMLTHEENTAMFIEEEHSTIPSNEENTPMIIEDEILPVEENIPIIIDDDITPIIIEQEHSTVLTNQENTIQLLPESQLSDQNTSNPLNATQSRDAITAIRTPLRRRLKLYRVIQIIVLLLRLNFNN